MKPCVTNRSPRETSAAASAGWGVVGEGEFGDHCAMARGDRVAYRGAGICVAGLGQGLELVGNARQRRYDNQYMLAARAPALRNGANPVPAFARGNAGTAEFQHDPVRWTGWGRCTWGKGIGHCTECRRATCAASHAIVLVQRKKTRRCNGLPRTFFWPVGPKSGPAKASAELCLLGRR